jgi:uncharacterized surface protein with fasciclin (FAS1) repeats
MNTLKATLVTISLAALFAVVGPVSAKQAADGPNLVQVAQALNASGPFAGEFDTLILLAGSDPEILEILTSKGQHTVFAPTDDAFGSLVDVATENCILLTDDTVNAVLKYHVVNGRRNSSAVIGSRQIRTLLGAFFAQSGGFITDNAGQVAQIIATDVPATNGVIHAIDTVLLPFPIVSQCGG